MAKQLTLDEKAQILEDSAKKVSMTEISKKPKKSQPCISNFLKRYKQSKTLHRKERSGRPPKVSQRDKSRVLREMAKNRKKRIDLLVFFSLEDTSL